MARYVALLRGINVGGNNIIKMSDLAACFEDGGFTNVTTYINSGNVLFDATTSGKLVDRVEKMIAARFAFYTASVAVRSVDEMRAIVEEAPKGFGKDPTQFRYDVFFLKPPLTSAAALPSVPLKEGVDAVWAGTDVLYNSRLVAKVTQSKISKIAGTPIYKSITIRNWNTTTKLLALMKGRDTRRQR
ncbi:MAG: DUF1697 domain-containing protein [Deltaproteobacteria bacterium]|nr:DUF1697 domain-containing protein [Deltaproteobacteria bacterium]